jgi:hypothetical protein
MEELRMQENNFFFTCSSIEDQTPGPHAPKRAEFTCFTGVKVQILTPENAAQVEMRLLDPTLQKGSSGGAAAARKPFREAVVFMVILNPKP